MAKTKKAKPADLSVFGKRNLAVGDETILVSEPTGANKGDTVKIVEIKHGGAMFRVKVVKGLSTGRSFLVAANQLQ